MEQKLFDWINKRLEEESWSYNELGRRSELSSGYVSLVMSGQRPVTFDFCASIARALGERPEVVFRLAGLLPASSGKMDDLNEEEAEVVRLYRRIPVVGREYVFKMLRGLIPP